MTVWIVLAALIGFLAGIVVGAWATVTFRRDMGGSGQ
jgi:hypothetical protein